MSTFHETQYGPLRVVEVRDEDQPVGYYFETIGADAMGEEKWDEIPERGSVVLIQRHHLIAVHQICWSRLRASVARHPLDLSGIKERLWNIAPNCRASERKKVEAIAAEIEKVIAANVLGADEAAA